MTALVNGIWKLKIWKETRGQDLVEFALIGGFVALAGAAVFPAIGDGVGGVFNKVLVDAGAVRRNRASAADPTLARCRGCSRAADSPREQ